MMEFDINKLHSIQVQILDYFVSVCEENGLCYVLVDGTALGAYRHKGFIPWDDDLDVGMPREDYQSFLDIMKSRVESEFSIQNEDYEESWFLSFSKIRKNNTVFMEGYADGIYQNNGIYIDIFPLDYLTNKSRFKVLLINYIKHCLKFRACRDLYKSKEGVVKYLADNLICLPTFLLKRKRLLELLNKLCIGKCRKSEAKYIVEYDDSIAQASRYDVYFPAREIEFEGKMYFAPGKITDYLTDVYGSTYMELPPVELRQTHQPIEVKM